jgi:hypothetical protein
MALVLCTSSNTGFRVGKDDAWQSLESVVKKLGDRAWLPKGFLTKQRAFPASVLVYWKPGEKEPWCLATNMPDRKLVLQCDQRRMWIEEMFGDCNYSDLSLRGGLLLACPDVFSGSRRLS